MSKSAILVPTDDELEASSGLKVIGRELIRETALSFVQRLQVDDQQRPTVVLKVTVPELRHESAVHEFASGMEICGAKLIASNSEAPFPWLIQEDVGAETPAREFGLQDVAELLESLAEFHAMSVTGEISGRSPVAVSDRSLSWLVANYEDVEAVVEPAISLADPYQRLQQPNYHFAFGLDRLAKIVDRIPVTLVHGDFDPGNLVYSRGRWRAIDWGLSHWNIPFVDVSHMLQRFPTKEHLPLIQRYLDAAASYGLELKGDYQVWELDQHGNYAHDAFFTWWHSLCVTKLGMPVEAYADSLNSRYGKIRAKSPQLNNLLDTEFGEPANDAEPLDGQTL